MNRIDIWLLIIVAVAPCGCGEATAPAANLGEQGPLTVEKWKQLPVSQKYDESSFESLRLGDTKLQSERNWHKFMMNVVIPERKKDIPAVPGERPTDDNVSQNK
ncbi:hypothetical protein [Blastopirellula retiformator]|uniref:Uncharacterized protein n=1 Tax=Blastopirellula retiformator TaxID=2527970 RepID=A0A5C5V484_9BACT|nr:hypothetical protein [Blastopirellula retiformator]TWT32769.1 hypothetical protein Enr8_25750 [Blastopirellula retiformator]